MATYKKLAEVIAYSFAPKSGYTPAVGDYVTVNAAREIDIAADGEPVIGQIEAVDDSQPTNTCTVRTPFRQVRSVTSSAAVTVGAYIVAAGSNKFRDYNSGGGDVITDIVGVALTGTVGGDAAFIAGLYV